MRDIVHVARDLALLRVTDALNDLQLMYQGSTKVNGIIDNVYELYGHVDMTDEAPEPQRHGCNYYIS